MAIVPVSRAILIRDLRHVAEVLRDVAQVPLMPSLRARVVRAAARLEAIVAWLDTG